MSVAPVVLIGVGELGGVFARGLLRTGNPLYPVHRDTNIQVVADTVRTPSLVLLTVAEDHLHAVLKVLRSAGAIAWGWCKTSCCLEIGVNTMS